MTEPTDDEIDALVAAYLGDCGPQATRVYSFVRAVLAKWGTPAPVGVEPFEPAAYLHDDGYWTPARTDEGRKLNDRLLRAGSPKIGVYLSAHTAPSVLEDAARWQEHVGKLDALVAYCPTCCQGFIAQKDMTRDQIIFECGRTAGRAAKPAVQAGEDGTFLILPPRPKAEAPANTVGLDWDAYSGMQMLAYGRACADAAIAAHAESTGR